jgi:hypothetical protein
LTRWTREAYSASMASWSMASFWYWRCSFCIDWRSFSSTAITFIFSATRFLSLMISSYLRDVAWEG